MQFSPDGLVAEVLSELRAAFVDAVPKLITALVFLAVAYVAIKLALTAIRSALGRQSSSGSERGPQSAQTTDGRLHPAASDCRSLRTTRRSPGAYSWLQLGQASPNPRPTSSPSGTFPRLGGIVSPGGIRPTM